MEGHLRGVAICGNGPQVSHLFFAEDSILFCQATEFECEIFLDILEIYERGFGQKINRENFSNSNTTYPLQAQIQHLLGVPVVRQYEKYLGLPALVGHAKKQSFVYLKERVWKAVIKAVIQAILTYTMSYFKVPKGLVKELEILIRKFWWGYNADARKVHWVSW